MVAAAVVDRHRFLAYVTRLGELAATNVDTEIAVGALELSFSRLQVRSDDDAERRRREQP